MVKQKLYNATFPHTFNYLLRSFQNDEESHEKRFQVVIAVLKEIDSKDMHCSQNSDLTSRICIELIQFKTEHLICLCLLCVEFIQKGNVTNIR